ncbi:MAG: GntR family transcriptional regulator [Bradyrhizobium sp.]|jgi:GntR family transcriptional regulator|nr:GntR family transcriptional regulator [Bradyrhizobium sp.]
MSGVKGHGKRSEAKSPPPAAGGPHASLGYRPLYRQVKELLIKRLGDGSWVPGQLLPSEPEIAAGLGVSPGTVRKALDEMSSESLLVRRQGRGTFVASHDEARILFQFFRMVSDTGERRFPESRIVSVSVARADERAAARLDIAAKDSVVTIERVRSLDGRPCIHEHIVLPRALFPGIERIKELPNNLYALYSTRYGVTIARGSETLKAVAAGRRQVELLGCQPGEPILLIDRVASGVDGTRAEWRRSLCRTDRAHYLTDLK